MSDFTDFLAAMVIKDSFEEEEDEKDSSTSSSSGSTKTETTTGCLFACVGIFIDIGIGVVFESFWLLIGISTASIAFGVIHDVISG